MVVGKEILSKKTEDLSRKTESFLSLGRGVHIEVFCIQKEEWTLQVELWKKQQNKSIFAAQSSCHKLNNLVARGVCVCVHVCACVFAAK